MALVPDLIAELADDILESVVVRLAAAGISVPERRYRHVGEVALDCCDMLAITATVLDHVIPGGEASIAICAPPRAAHFDVWLTRCVPGPTKTGQPPSAADLDASGVEIMTDMYSLPYVLWAGYQAKEWGGTCSAVILGPVEAYGPSGECGGVHAGIDILLT